jgi:hypothetical protein
MTYTSAAHEMCGSSNVALHLEKTVGKHPRWQDARQQCTLASTFHGYSSLSLEMPVAPHSSDMETSLWWRRALM